MVCLDGSQVVVAVGNRVLVYDAKDGDLLHSLKGWISYILSPFSNISLDVVSTVIQVTKTSCIVLSTAKMERDLRLEARTKLFSFGQARPKDF